MFSVTDIMDTLESPAWGGSPTTITALGQGLRVFSVLECHAGVSEHPWDLLLGLTPGQWQLLTKLLCCDPATLDYGAMLAPNSSMVALSLLFAGIQMGLRSGRFGRPLPSLNPLLILSLLSPSLRLWGHLSW